MNSKLYHIKLNGKVYELEIEEVDRQGKSSLKVEKEEVIQEGTKEVVAMANSSEGQKVEAPMPGNVIDILVNVDDVVKSGQTLVILEAMKMENEIVSPVDGKVIAINVSKGQSVNSEDILIRIG
ncbi:acetyl-CoA carboxylase biotin carboxyl carrier protein subunit [Clostridium sp. D2Q-14]|uniref:biotin/lipoyl-containing protein n=1 Tax=Anaeromonas gelatinilytica TaxID=2683194 RepID=UPI00193BC24A|nr:biotin/lipoyl-containing protein [Anaeromonas gelatinilytica]MBS4534732.1 acetyl-CoA carboxylase biotin carboxyl carrier protein subunit [Anaeromonas gelatinilytica]